MKISSFKLAYRPTLVMSVDLAFPFPNEGEQIPPARYFVGILLIGNLYLTGTKQEAHR